jgi:hypothetical protein
LSIAKGPVSRSLRSLISKKKMATVLLHATVSYVACSSTVAISFLLMAAATLRSEVIMFVRGSRCRAPIEPLELSFSYAAGTVTLFI